MPEAVTRMSVVTGGLGPRVTSQDSSGLCGEVLSSGNVHPWLQAQAASCRAGQERGLGQPEAPGTAPQGLQRLQIPAEAFGPGLHGGQKQPEGHNAVTKESH